MTTAEGAVGLLGAKPAGERTQRERGVGHDAHVGVDTAVDLLRIEIDAHHSAGELERAAAVEEVGVGELAADHQHRVRRLEPRVVVHEAAFRESGRGRARA